MNPAGTNTSDSLSTVILDADSSRRPLDKYDGPLLMENQDRRRFHVMNKPAGSACNLDCSYCFYLSKAKLPDGPGTLTCINRCIRRTE
jgi:uncharacterized radical SAM superfamily Fe-S cluster-containing enzyme